MSAEPRSARCVIIGSGPAGYTAAVYAARAMLAPVLIAGLEPGGQLTITTDVENYPGFADVIQGPWLMEQMRAQAEHVGAECLNDIVVEADLSRRPFRLTCDSGQVFLAETVIIATGAQAKWLGLDSREQRSRASASRPAPPATASSTAARRCWWSAAATPRSRRPSSSPISPPRSPWSTAATSCAPRRSCRTASSPIRAIEVIWDTALEEVLGAEAPRSVTGARLKNLKTHEDSEIACDGIFIAIGHAPASALFEGQLEMDRAGYLKVRAGTTATEIEASMPPATSPTTSTARRSPPPAWAAWRRWRRCASSPRRTTSARTTRSATPRRRRSASGDPGVVISARPPRPTTR